MTEELPSAPGSTTEGGEELSTAALAALARALPERIDADPAKVEQGLARLVLTVVELLRKVLEHQAVRRMDGGTLSDAEIETLGLALLRLDERMGELKKVFGLTDADLNIDLGPLGRLL
jgi:Gas vesicle protein K